MKKLFRNGVTLAYLSLILLNPTLSRASDVSPAGDEQLSIGTASVSVKIFIKVVQDLHKDDNAQGALRDKEFLKAFATLTQEENQHPLISMMTPETKKYLRTNVLTLLPMASGQDSAALKVLEILGMYEIAQLNKNLKGMALLEQKWTQEEREEIIAEGHGTSLETLFPQFYDQRAPKNLEELQGRKTVQSIEESNKSIAASLEIIRDVKKGTDARALQNQDEGALEESTSLGRMEDLGKGSLTEDDPAKLQQILQALQELLKEAKS